MFDFKFKDAKSKDITVSTLPSYSRRKRTSGQRKLGFQQLTWGLNEEVTTIKKQQKKLPINILNFLFDNMRRKLCYIYYRIFPILIHQ